MHMSFLCRHDCANVEDNKNHFKSINSGFIKIDWEKNNWKSHIISQLNSISRPLYCYVMIPKQVFGCFNPVIEQLLILTTEIKITIIDNPTKKLKVSVA